MVKKACVVTATRAEYGLLKPLIDAFQNSDSYQLQLIVSGTHLSAEFGMTWKAIEQDGFTIDAKVDMLLGNDSATAVVKSLGLMCIGISEAFERLQPDFVVILGDRYEMLGVAIAANLFKIPVMHLCGGEITEGALDDNFRHALTKLSHIHFTATDEYRNRVIQLGEQPKYVHNSGAIGLDSVHNLPLMTKAQLAESLNVDLSGSFFLMTYHPVTVTTQNIIEEIDNIMRALLSIDDISIITTLSNADVGGRAINECVRSWSEKYPNRIYTFTSLGQLRYLSAMKYCEAVVGNSSSGIVEAPSMFVPTINIGDRQEGRMQAASIVNCEPTYDGVTDALRSIRDSKFKESLLKIDNPYGQGDTVDKIMNFIQDINWSELLKKKFFNINNLR